MNMDMDMDVAWCLTCSKQTRDARNPYCSDACRLKDTDLPTQETVPPLLTSPMPYGLLLSPKQPTPGLSPKRYRSPTRRPSIDPLAVMSSSYRTKPVPRDRRAFSFPAIQATAPMAIKPSTSRRPTQTIETLQFARKANPISINSMAASPGLGPSSQGKVKGFTKLSKTTGANTPVFQDSVFCSTSESSDNEAIDLKDKDVSPRKLPQPLAPAQTTLRAPSYKHRASMPNSFMPQSSAGSTRLPTPLSTVRPPLVTRKSPSPVAAMIASSASSKSREDIVSWLNEVKRVPAKDCDSEQERLDDTSRVRGRSRTRREVLANLPPPSTETIDDLDGEGGVYGTTPKGRIGSALAGLSTLGSLSVGPFVKALTGGASSTSPYHVDSALGLHAVPTPAGVSRVAITVATTSEFDNDMLHMGGVTPTLSTVSLSEAIDPLTDNGDHMDFMTNTDDQSAAGSSSFVRRVRSPSHGQPTSVLTASAPKNRPLKDSLPLKPIASTASAIWNLSSYLRSFAPFSIASAIAQPSTTTATVDVPVDSCTPTAAPSPTKTFVNVQPLTAPVAATRAHIKGEEESPAQQMVRSLPMDIIIPTGADNPHDERLRRLEMKEWLEAPASREESRSRSRAKHHSPSRGRHRSRSHSRSASHSESHPRHARKVSYDADASGEDEPIDVDAERRGRSRREKMLRKTSDEKRRGREEERGRGRDRERTVRV
ncbi:hypothetical protein IAU60_000461 [Kwoniella sp. DSM 27419]